MDGMSSSNVQGVSGTMLWINLHLEWTGTAGFSFGCQHIDGVSVTCRPFQTYLVHRQTTNSINSEMEDDSWWQRQSNVLGVVIGAIVLAPNVLSSYPKVSGAITQNFIPDLIVEETNFRQLPGKAKLDALSFSGDRKTCFLLALNTGLGSVCDIFARKRQHRCVLKFLGCSKNLAKAALDEDLDAALAFADFSQTDFGKRLPQEVLTNIYSLLWNLEAERCTDFANVKPNERKRRPKPVCACVYFSSIDILAQTSCDKPRSRTKWRRHRKANDYVVPDHAC